MLSIKSLIGYAANVRKPNSRSVRPKVPASIVISAFKSFFDGLGLVPVIYASGGTNYKLINRQPHVAGMAPGCFLLRFFAEPSSRVAAAEREA